MRAEGFIDLHQHVLWGLDDGPKTREQMFAMLGMAANDGIGLIAATSHAYPARASFQYESYLERLREANSYCAEQGWNLRLVSGCEIHYCGRVPDLLIDGKLPTLDQSKLVLIEFDLDIIQEEIEQAADSLYRVGFRPIIAHVERYRCLVHSPKRAMAMRDECGLIYQMNCQTVLHPHGLWEGLFVKKMLENRAIDLVATDAHDMVRRPVCMNAAYQELSRRYGADYARELCFFGL